MSEAFNHRTVLVWDHRCPDPSVSLYSADEYNDTFDEEDRTQLLAGLHIDNDRDGGIVDLEAFYHRARSLVPA
jgi:hypothetical protein